MTDKEQLVNGFGVVRGRVGVVRTALAAAVVLIALGALQAGPAAAAVGPLCPSPGTVSLPSDYPAAQLSTAQASFLKLAQRGVAAAAAWDNGTYDWFNGLLKNNPKSPLAKVWDAVPLFESVDEVALASPTATNLGLVKYFARCAESYWDKHVQPHGGYAPYPKSWNLPNTFFDDNTWWSLAFLDAYTAMQQAAQHAAGTYQSKLQGLARRYLRDAIRGFNFILAGAWDAHGGGLWWNTDHTTRSGEVLGGATQLAAELYALTGNPADLRWALRNITWANRHLMKWDGQYSNNQLSNEVIMPHDGEGMMIDAYTTLCQAGVDVPGSVYSFLPANKYKGVGPSYERPYTYVAGVAQDADPSSWCSWAEALAWSTVRGVDPGNRWQDGFLPFYEGGAAWEGPQWDAIYIRGLLALYANDGNPQWYTAAVKTARAILNNARGAGGIFTKAWDGSTHVDDAEPGMLRTHAASVSVLADLATVPPPTG